MKLCSVIILFGLCVSLFEACLPPIQEDLNSTSYSKDDPVYRQIKNYQDQRKSDSLIYFLSNPKAAYRLLAAEAFGSYRDSNAISPLQKLLTDNNESVRQAAIFSLGQIGNIKAESELVKAFIPIDSTGPYMLTNAMILEALGKCASDSILNFICKIKTYKETNSILLEGQMLAFFRFGLRNKICSNSTPLIVEVATNKNYSEKSRLIAAHCLQRFKSLDVKAYYKELRNASFEEKNENIRMALIASLARVGTAESLSSLEELYSRILDNRIQCNLIRGLQNYPNGMATSLAMKALQNPSIQVSALASEYFLNHGTTLDVKELSKLVLEGKLPWQCKSFLYEALIKITPAYKTLQRDYIFSRLIEDINKSRSAYEKAAYIKALKNSPEYLSFILKVAAKEKNAYVLTSITECISQIYKNPSFTLIYKGKFNPIYTSITSYLHNQCNNLDVGSIAVIAEWFRTEKGIINKYFKPDSTLSIVLSSLHLPKDIETYNAVENTLGKLNNRKYIEKKPEFNHPIDWKLLDHTRDTIAAEINTSKGKLEIELYPKMAPGSVVNFLNLIENKFFSGKIIHRIVPNFVIQVGCPRGDGYGSLDYSIRTETGSILNYEAEGMIGMASAGLDTECSQFFITYSATPHLDGKYTIFGKLIKGMDILSLMEQGDQITEIKIH